MIVSGCVRDGAGFYRVSEGRFVSPSGEAYYFIGANMWYGAFAAAAGPECDRERLCRELDALKGLGVTNLRIAVGAEGSDGDEVKVKPILQTAPGEYNDAMLDGLDYLMSELSRRDMQAVLYLTNSWTWSGGNAQYLEWGGCGECPIAERVGWRDDCDYMTRFYGPESGTARRMLDDHIRFIVTRTNRYTGVPYIEEPALFSWQLCNEPRPFSAEAESSFVEWVASTARLIKSLDPNHMVSVGSEGEIGCNVDLSLWERIHSIPEIDYATLHIWPYNWRWVDRATFESDVATACRMSEEYISRHAEAARRIGKPLVVEEFGYPRDGFRFDAGSSVAARDCYYESVFGQIAASASSSDVVCGCNFWGWGGSARPAHLWWERGDAYCGDPAQEEQGLYSVFDCDTTVEVISRAASSLH